MPTVSAWKKVKDRQDLWYDNSRLDRLQEIQQNNADENWLNATEAEFVRKSLTTKKNRRKRTTYISTAIIFSLSILSVTATIFAFQADQRRRIQFSRQLAANSEVVKEQGEDLHETSVLLALEGYKRSYEINKPSRASSQTNAALYSAFNLLPNHVLLPIFKPEVEEIEFSPDSQYVVTYRNDGTIKLFQTSTREEIPLPHQTKVEEIEFSPDSQYVVAYRNDGAVKLFEISTREEIVIPHQTKVEEIEFSPDSQYVVAYRNDGAVKLFEISTREEIVIPYRFRTRRIKFSPDNQYVATASDDGAVKLFEISTREEIIIPYQFRTGRIKFSPDNRYLATVDTTNTAKIFEISKDQKTVIFDETEVLKTKFSPDSQYVVLGYDNETVKRFETSTGEEIISKGEEIAIFDEDEFNKVKSSPNNQYVATASDDGVVKIVEKSTGKETIIFHEAEIRDLEFSSDSQYFATASSDRTAKLVELKTGQETVIFHEAEINRVEFSSDNQHLATGDWGGTVKLHFLNPQTIIDLTCNKLSQNLSLTMWQRYLGEEPYRQTCPELPIHHSFFQEAKELARSGKINEAVDIFKQAQKLDPETEIDAELWKDLCWFGSLNKEARKVMFACNKAVATINSEENFRIGAEYRDSRGLAFAQMGKIEKAIEDFQFFVDRSQADEQLITRRKAWIEALKKGENPFTNEVLEELKNE
ncbi:MAG: hypothetical protein AAF383_01495 [Cyanobacteria bacterium P01_A01_bin.83]